MNESEFDLGSYYPHFRLPDRPDRLRGHHAFRRSQRRPDATTPRASRCPTNRAWTRSATPGSSFDVKFYLIAILFLVFDVELLFLYPWAVVAYQDGALLPAGVRATWSSGRCWSSSPLLVVAYVYAWRKGVFQWR